MVSSGVGGGRLSHQLSSALMRDSIKSSAQGSGAELSAPFYDMFQKLNLLRMKGEGY